jgi:molybdenum-dependent DNA-binding transcriptional regulator ModE
MAHFGMRKKGLDRFILAIASGRTVRAAAKYAHISERTAWRHTADTAVQFRIAAIRRQLVTRAVGRLSAGMTAAARELERLLRRDPSANVRLAAARTILDFGARLGTPKSGR